MTLWEVPRSVSTAFERGFIERGNFEVFHEPFFYYHSEDRRHDRYAEDPASEEYDFDRALEKLAGHTERPVFFKDMAYYVKPVMTPEFVSRFTNTFIIRHPKRVLSPCYERWSWTPRTSARTRRLS